MTHRPLRSSFLGLPYRIRNINHKKELLRGLWGDLKWTLCSLSLPELRVLHVWGGVT